MKYKLLKFLTVIFTLTLIISLSSVAFSAFASELYFSFTLDDVAHNWSYSAVNNKSDDEQMAYINVTYKGNSDSTQAKVVNTSHVAKTTTKTFTGTGRFTLAYSSYVSSGTPMQLAMRTTGTSHRVSGVWNS